MSRGGLARVAAAAVVAALAGAGAGAVSMPAAWRIAVGLVAFALVLGLERLAAGAPIERLVWGAVAGLAGLVGGAVLGGALVTAVPGIGPLAYALGAVLGLYLGAAVGARRGPELTGLNAQLLRPETAGRAIKLVDTSALIDGRIADLAATGFVEGPLVVPQFVLRELQQVADSTDPRKRARGKRGFDIVQRLQRLPGPPIEIAEIDVAGPIAVDQKLLDLAKARGAKIITTDYNLNRLAEVNGVGVLNVNELANALKSAAVAGEEMRVRLMREGKEPGQGVGYLADGTMVVVEHGKRWIGQTVDAVVTSVLQTPSGRIVFARLRDEEPERA